MGLATSLEYLFPGAVVANRIVVCADADGERIAAWDATLGTQPTAQEIADAALPAAQQQRLSRIRAEASNSILAKWPTWAQTNCALGIYPQATAAQCAADIAAVVTASNTAEDAVAAATTVAEVEAVTATWPAL